MDLLNNQEFMSYVIVPALLGIILIIMCILGFDFLDK